MARSVSFPSYSERCVGCLLCDKFPGARGLDGQQLSPHGVGRSGVRCQPSRGGCRAVGRGCGLLLGLDSGQERGVGGWTVGGLQAPLSRVGGFSPLSWEPLPSAASQQDRGFPRRARESNLRRDAPSPLPILFLTNVGSPASQREGRLGAWAPGAATTAGGPSSLGSRGD